MTKLVLLGGPPGVGKSSVLKLLTPMLPAAGWVDADDVWRVSSDIDDEAHRAITHSNVNAVLEGYLEAGCRTVGVAWVFARPQLYEPIVQHFRRRVSKIRQVYLTAEPEILETRIRQCRLEQGGAGKTEDAVAYSMSRLALIEALPYTRIDTSHRSGEVVADMLATLLFD